MGTSISWHPCSKPEVVGGGQAESYTSVCLCVMRKADGLSRCVLWFMDKAILPLSGQTVELTERVAKACALDFSNRQVVRKQFVQHKESERDT